MKLFLSAFLALVLAVIGLPSQGLTTTYIANLDGPSEFQPNASPGTGSAVVTLDTIGHTLSVYAEFSGLLGTTTAAHIHGPTPIPGTDVAGVITQTPTFAGFPSGVTSGTYDQTFDLTLASSWNPAFLRNNVFSPLDAETALDSYLAGGTAYFNIHSSMFPAGEIRGFLVPSPVPLPATMLLFGTGLAGLAGIRLRRKKP
jgi:hypothetical protein